MAIRDRNDWCPTSLDLLDVAERLPGTLVVTSDDREYRRVGRDERQRPMFELTCWEPLGVFVADLLAFECTLQGDRDVRSPSDEEVRVRIGVLLDEFRGSRGVENLLNVVREVAERLD